MAQKRMFNLKIIDTDLFLEMSVSARLLYYDLSMRADDDGFVASPKKIQRMIGASDDDLKILIAKQFIIPFDTGICVIRHWRIHNYIQKDRYQETLYLEEKAKIQDDKGTYNLLDTECVQNGHKMDTQVRLDKVRLDKLSIEPKKTKNVPVKKIKYGDRVTLTIEEYKKLTDTYTKPIIDEKIIDLDLWKGGKGKTTKSDYLTLLAWLRKDAKTFNNKQTQSSQITPKCKGV